MHFEVKRSCAALKLQMLGYQISTEQLEKLKSHEIQRQKAAEKRKSMKQLEQNDDMYGHSNETFYFIAGYTSNGIPYGLTWDEIENSFRDLVETNDSEELPFLGV